MRIDTYPNRRPRAQQSTLIILKHTPRLFNNGVNRQRRQAHTGQALEHSPFGHDNAVVFDQRDGGRGPRRERFLRRRPRLRRAEGAGDVAGRHAEDDVPVGGGILVGLAGRGEHVPVAQVGLVAFVGDVADEVGPGDGVGGADEIGVRDGAEGLAYVGGVGYVAVGGEEDCAEAVGVTGVAVGGVC